MRPEGGAFEQAENTQGLVQRPSAFCRGWLLVGAGSLAGGLPPGVLGHLKGLNHTASRLSRHLANF